MLSSKAKFEDTKEDRQWLKAKGQQDNDLPKTKDRATRIPKKSEWGVLGRSHLFHY